jgi:peptide-methionine (S)-S-oxide reductase
MSKADIELPRTDEEWQAKLTPEQFQVLRQHGTEPRGASPLNREKRTGTFVCAGCGQPLFVSGTKYESGTGWPSFWEPLPASVATTTDRSYGMTRTEVHCARCGGHLGHVFPDGPPPTGERYCMNGVAMEFSPRSDAMFGKSLKVPAASEALPGRSTRMSVPAAHYVNGHRLEPPFPQGLEQAMFGMGCFWGAERKFWQLPGVYTTAVGYAAGHTPNPTYREVCTGMTGHTEAVLVVFDPQVVRYDDLLKVFWESHDPTQGMRQGNDVGTQYRSGIYVFDDEQRRAAESSRAMFQQELTRVGYGPITTEILEAPEFYYAEEYHQQYLAKNPGGYCGLGGTGVSCPVGVATSP